MVERKESKTRHEEKIHSLINSVFLCDDIPSEIEASLLELLATSPPDFNVNWIREDENNDGLFYNRIPLINKACRMGSIPVVKKLLEFKELELNSSIAHDTPLATACFRGHFRVIALLLSDPRVDPSKADWVATDRKLYELLEYFCVINGAKSVFDAHVSSLHFIPHHKLLKLSKNMALPPVWSNVLAGPPIRNFQKDPESYKAVLRAKYQLEGFFFSFKFATSRELG